MLSVIACCSGIAYHAKSGNVQIQIEKVKIENPEIGRME